MRRPRGGARTNAIAALVLVAIACIAMLVAGTNPIAGFAALARGSLGGPHQLAETLVQATSLLFPALTVAFAFRAGFFNIGAEGQLVMGGLAAGVVGAIVPGPGPVAIVAMLAAGALGGAAWGTIAGGLRARFGGSEVVATLMLNVIAALLANFLVVGPLRAIGAESGETPSLALDRTLPVLFAGTRLTIAFPLALLIAAALWFFLARTVAGYTLRAVGDAPLAAARAGIDLPRMAVFAFAISGAIAGLGGATIVAGVLHRFNVALSPGYGFIAIAVALVGNLDPPYIVLAALGFGILQNGSLAMQSLAHVPKDAVTIVEGLAIVALAARRSIARRTA